jgi:phosphohistidine phosphatase SixA
MANSIRFVAWQRAVRARSASVASAMRVMTSCLQRRRYARVFCAKTNCGCTAAPKSRMPHQTIDLHQFNPRESTDPMATPPYQIVIIRHAEKPGGNDDDATSTDPNLSLRGYERAAALAPFLPPTFGQPDFLFASQASSSSNRPVETITPLANSLGMKINSSFADADYLALANSLLNTATYAGQLVLICWHHGKIPKLATALGVTPPLDPWPSDVFDRVWQITYPQPPGSGGSPTVINYPQKLLFGDSAT